MLTMKTSHQRSSVKKGVLRDIAKFMGKYLCLSIFYKKVAGLRPQTLLKKRLRYRSCRVNFAKTLRTPFLQDTCGGVSDNTRLMHGTNTPNILPVQSQR